MKNLTLLFAAPGAALLCRQTSVATKQILAGNRRRTLATLLAAAIMAVGLFGLTPPARAQKYLWTNFAGKPGGAGNSDGTGAAATFGSPRSVAVDSNGNVYVADATNNAIRKVTPAGVVTTFAGSMTAPAGFADGTGSAARFSLPQGIAVDANGNVYVADTNNQIIRKITPAGVVTTLAGSAGMFGSTDGTGSAARFTNPTGIAVDVNGNVYVADTNNSTIRMVTSVGVVTTLAGSPGHTGSTNGTGSAARFNFPEGLTVDGNGNVYVADTSNSTIRKVTSAGVVTTLAGSAGMFGGTDGTGSAARFSFPVELALDTNGNIYVADSNNDIIRKVTSAGVVTTLAGTAGNFGFADGTGSAAQFDDPQGVAVDHNGNVYVGDTFNTAIRKVTPAAVVTTLAGSATNNGNTNGTGTAARFGGPYGVGVDSSGNVYVADNNNQTIRKITPAGVVTTLAGSAGMFGSTDGTGGAARFDDPQGLAVDANGNIYVTDRENETIRKITPAGVVTTLAGSPGMFGSADGTGSAARFSEAYGIAVDKNGNVYVADTSNCTIRKITPAGVVTTLAGDASAASGFVDGTGSAARFDNPKGVAVDSNGNVYVADTNNSAIRKITPAGAVTTLAGDSAGNSGFADGTGSAARFEFPEGVAVDSFGNVFVADSYNYVIRKVTSAGVVTTIGGNPNVYGGADGIGAAAVFSYPVAIAVSPGGLLYVTDNNEDRVVRGTTQYDHDFNGDGHPDYLLFNASSLQTAVWYLNGSSFVSAANGPTLPSGWSVVATADFNGDGHPDLLLLHASDLKTYIYYMNGATAIGSAPGPTLPAGWSIAGVADFNGDGHPDLFLFHASDLKTYVWYMNGPSVLTSAPGPTLPAGWSIAGLADFNSDGHPDLFLFHASDLKTYVWYLNGLSVTSTAPGPTAPAGWTVSGTVDFNGDGKPDLLFIHPSDLKTYIWYLNGLSVLSTAPGPTLPAGWSLISP